MLRLSVGQMAPLSMAGPRSLLEQSAWSDPRQLVCEDPGERVSRRELWSVRQVDVRGEAGEAGVEDDAVGAALSLVVTWGPACWRGARRLQVRPVLAFVHLAPHGRKADGELCRPGGANKA